MLRTAVVRVLKSRGYEVVVAETPERAIQIFREDPGAFDLLLTDVVLPGASGPATAECLARLRAEAARRPRRLTRRALIS